MTPSRVAFYGVFVSCLCAILLFPVDSAGESPSGKSPSAGESPSAGKSPSAGESPAPPKHPTRKMSNAQIRIELDGRGAPKTKIHDDLASAIDFMRDVTGVTFDVQWDKLKPAGITEKTPVNVDLGQATMREILTAILASAGGKPGVVGFTNEKGTIVIGPAKPPPTPAK